MKLPALMEAVIPPCIFESGCPKYSRYCLLPIQADMLLTSNPKSAPPIVPLDKRSANNATIQEAVMMGGAVLQAGEDVDIPDSIHGCCCPMESGQQGRSGLFRFRGRSVGGQLGIRMVFQTGDVRSIYCRLRVGCNAMLPSKVVGAMLHSVRCSSCGSRGGHDCQ